MSCYGMAWHGRAHSQTEGYSWTHMSSIPACHPPPDLMLPPNSQPQPLATGLSTGHWPGLYTGHWPGFYTRASPSTCVNLRCTTCLRTARGRLPGPRSQSPAPPGSGCLIPSGLWGQAPGTGGQAPGQAGQQKDASLAGHLPPTAVCAPMTSQKTGY